jgi:hypothetical protein
MRAVSVAFRGWHPRNPPREDPHQMKLTRAAFFRTLMGVPVAIAAAAVVPTKRAPAVSRLPWYFDFKTNNASDRRLMYGGYEIFCDGVSLPSCFAANQAEGWARCYARQGDEFILDGSDVRTVEYRGKLQICKRGWKPF